MRILCLLFIVCQLDTFAQTEDLRNKDLENPPKIRIGERGLNRFFFDGSLALGWNTQTSDGVKDSYRIYAALSDFRIGNNFYFGTGLKPMILRVTYFRTGIFPGDGILLYLVPPSIGLGKHFNIRNNDLVSLEPMVHVGVITTTGILTDGIEYYRHYVSAELKMNIALFTIGLEFTTAKVFQSSYMPSKNFERNTYIGLSIGRRFGKNLRFSN